MNMSNDDRKITDAWGNWFAGFTAGEGHFSIDKRNKENLCAAYGCRFQIHLRADDEPILEEIHNMLGIGTVYNSSSHANHSLNAHAKTYLWVHSIKDCFELVKIFERFPLRAKKHRDFSIWRCAVVEIQKPVSERNADLLEYYFRRIRQVRQYETCQELPKPVVVDIQLIIDF